MIRRDSMEYKWKAFSVTSVGSLMSAVDSTIVLLALVPIAEELRSDYVTMVWVVIAYILANTALVLSLGRLADMYGRKRMYNFGFVVFIVGSALCGFAFSGLTLVGFRALQGVGAAMLAANSFAILSEAFPRNERGKAFGANSIVWGSGTILGIILGGLIITYTSWRLIFLINVPIGAFGTLWAYRTLRATTNNARKRSFDFPATLTFTLGLVALLLGVTWGIIYSWTSSTTLVSVAVSPFFFLFFVYWETKRSKDPVVDFTFFRNRVFTLSIVTAMIQSLALFSVNFLLLFYLEGIAGLNVLVASYLIIPMALASSVVGPFAGRFSDRFGARIVASIGLLAQMIVLLMLSGLTTTTTLLQVGVIEALYGIGSGLFWPANTSAIMASAPPESYGVASGIMNTFRNSGMVMSFALALTALTGGIPTYMIYQLFIGTFSGTLAPNYAAAYLAGQSFAFELSAGLLVLAAVFSLARGKEARHIALIPPVPASVISATTASTEARRTSPVGNERRQGAPNPSTVNEIAQENVNELERRFEGFRNAYAEQLQTCEKEVEELFWRFNTRLTELLNSRLLEFNKSLEQIVTRYTESMQRATAVPVYAREKLPRACDACGSACQPGANYCDRCGRRL